MLQLGHRFVAHPSPARPGGGRLLGSDTYLGWCVDASFVRGIRTTPHHGTSVVSAQGASGSVTEELCVATAVLCSLCASWVYSLAFPIAAAEGGGSDAKKKSLCTQNPPPISGLFNRFRPFPEEKLSDGGWLVVGVGRPPPPRTPACHSRRFKGERPIGVATG